MYDVTFRYTSGNSTGGGPFHFEIDEKAISPSINMLSTNGWDTWKNAVLENIELTEGSHILRLVVTNGEFNLGRMTFDYKGSLYYVVPVADAGENISVLLPSSLLTLDGC